MDPAIQQTIQKVIDSDPVVLFMKGTRTAPRCGFSARVVQILDQLVPRYATFDVLSDPEVREGIKEYSSWPTIPQLYVRGKFIGGCDIVTDLFDSGELQAALGTAAAAPVAPHITVSERAARALREALSGPDDQLRLAVSADFEHDLSVGARQPSDLAVETSGLLLLLDRMSAARADGVVIDYVESPQGGGFTIDNPNQPPRVRPIDAAELKRRLAAGPLELYDCRGEAERARARLEQARPLDAAAQDHILGLPRSTPLYFHCHRGVRSQAAAEHFLAQGFTEVYNLQGGIDAWSREVDPAVERY